MHVYSLLHVYMYIVSIEVAKYRMEQKPGQFVSFWLRTGYCCDTDIAGAGAKSWTSVFQ